MKNFYIKIGFTVLVAVFITGGIVSAQSDVQYDPRTGQPIDASGAYVDLQSPTSGGDNSNSNTTGGDDSKSNTLGGDDSDDKKELIGLKNPLKVKTIGGLVQTAVEIFSYIVIIFAVLAFIWVGLQYILARGNSEKMKEMSKWLGYIVIGVAVVIGARVIISIVINTLDATGVVDQRVIKSSRDALGDN